MLMPVNKALDLLIVPTIVIKLEHLPSDKCSDELETVPGVTSEIEIEN
jgi:hypothetical protein